MSLSPLALAARRQNQYLARLTELLRSNANHAHVEQQMIALYSELQPSDPQPLGLGYHWENHPSGQQGGWRIVWRWTAPTPQPAAAAPRRLATARLPVADPTSRERMLAGVREALLRRQQRVE